MTKIQKYLEKSPYAVFVMSIVVSAAISQTEIGQTIIKGIGG
jgi:hypothetical protein